jgi:amidase
MNGLVGLKPTVGLLSRTYVVPISHSQDTPGPMVRSVRDAAVMLTVMAGSDPKDSETAEADQHKTDYTASLRPDGLRGARIGVLKDRFGSSSKTRALFDLALARLKASGATLVDIPDSQLAGLGDAEHKVLMFELKADLAAYFAGLPAPAPAKSLDDVIAFNRAHAAAEMPYFGQDLFEEAAKTNGLDDPSYSAARSVTRGGAGALLDRLMRDNDVALLVVPSTGPAHLSDLVNGDPDYHGPSSTELPATAGYPHLTVPMGRIGGLPVGISFIGKKWSEAALLAAGFAFEQTGAKTEHSPGGKE